MLLRSLVLAGFIAPAFSASSSTSAPPSSIISTQDLNGLPVCAQECLATGTAQQGTCSSVDIKCLCNNVEYINTVACCLDTKCNSSDQPKAASIVTSLCARVNVTIPNFLGCALTAAGKSSTSTQGQTSASTVITSRGSVVSIASNAAVAKFTGAPLLTGTCTNLLYASATLGSGTIIHYPWEGCSFDNPACCPFAVNKPGPLSVCPSDYYSTSEACCPLGWSVLPSALYGSQTPCYTTPSISLSGPITARALEPAATTTVADRVYSLRYPLKTSRRLSTGAIVGIAVGGAAGFLLVVLLLFFFIRRHRARKNAEKQAITGPSFSGPMDKVDRRSYIYTTGGPLPPGSVPISPYQPSEHISELPSPAVGERPGLPQNELWFTPGGAPPQPKIEEPPAPPVEMPGDTHLDQHHPAYNSGSSMDAVGVPRPESAVLPDSLKITVNPGDVSKS